MNPESIISAIKPIVIEQLQRNEAVISVLKLLQVDLVKPKAAELVYAYALVEYRESKPEPILKLFRNQEIKNAFLQAYQLKHSLNFLKAAENFLNNNNLRNEIEQSGIELRSELEEFGNIFISVARRTGAEEFKPYPDWDMGEYPAEFESLIKEKIRIFCGREFVFEAFGKFLNKHSKGYFTVVGDAGMGKSAITAKYVYARKYPCYFNIRAEGRNSPELFLKSIRQQLIKRYQLQNAEEANLQTLLEKVSKKLTSGERLVIVIDALDEVEQTSNGNLLDLPMTPPEHVYFLLTRRPYTEENKRLRVSPGIVMEELDLRAPQYVDSSRNDVKEYIRLFLNSDPEHKEALRKWIQERNITDDQFVEQVRAKSENNFMYLRYVLPGIARGFYHDLSLKQLPDGLQEYYQDHWQRMGMDKTPQEAKVIILFILVEIRRPIPYEMIAAIAQKDELEVEEVLKEWVEYLKTPKIKGRTCYTIYHASFLDFLKGKRELDSTRKLFKDVNQSIVNFFRRMEQRRAGGGRTV